MKTHQHKKRLGQHFLSDETVLIDIIKTVHPSNQDTFIEIGPGEGALTRALLEQGAKVLAIELDKDLTPKLDTLKQRYSNFDYLIQDALTVDYAALFQKFDHPRLIGNLPYNIATPLLALWLPLSSHLKDMHFMMQKEVITRICAKVGERDYSRLSLLTLHYCEAVSCFNIPPSAFTPPPKVDSSIVRITPHSTPKNPDISCATLSRWTQILFKQPRKTIRNNLKEVASEAEIQAVELSPSTRPQNVPYQALIQLIRMLD